MNEPNITRITTGSIKKLKLRGAEGQLGSIIKDTLNHAKKDIKIGRQNIRSQEQSISSSTTNSEEKEKFSWPICSECLKPTSAQPQKVPQWIEGKWWCEKCYFKDCFE